MNLKKLTQRSNKDYGLFTLPFPEPDWEAKHGEPTLDIVAVHGLNGGPFRSWTSEAPDGHKTSWLADLLPHRLPHARVMTFGYGANVLANTSVAGVRDNARKLLALLRDERDEDETTSTRPIVFVGHSLGGIIIKQALRIAENERAVYSGIADATKGILFFGTPHRGADAARWAGIVAGIAASASNKPATAFAKVLKPNSHHLVDLSEDFRSIATRYAIASFVEEDVFPGLGRVIVEKHSAVMEMPHEEAIMMSGNHSSMCKFDADDRRFNAVWKAIKRIANSDRQDRS